MKRLLVWFIFCQIKVLFRSAWSSFSPGVLGRDRERNVLFKFGTFFFTCYKNQPRSLTQYHNDTITHSAQGQGNIKRVRLWRDRFQIKTIGLKKYIFYTFTIWSVWEKQQMKVFAPPITLTLNSEFSLQRADQWPVGWCPAMCIVPMCQCAVVHCANVLFLMLVHSALYGVANSVFVTCLHTFVQEVLGCWCMIMICTSLVTFAHLHAYLCQNRWFGQCVLIVM